MDEFLKGIKNLKKAHFILSLFNLIIILPVLEAQTNELNEFEPLFHRRIVWRGDENAFRYAVEIEKSENGFYYQYLVVPHRL